LIEIYFLDLRRERDVSFQSANGKPLSLIHFYNETAREILEAAAIELTPAISTVARAQLPAGLGVGVRDYYFKILSA
jgi:hypothetical protein